MSKTVLQMESSAIYLQDQIEYPEAGILSKVLLKDNSCQYTLFCLAAGTEISEHTATRNATVQVLAGKGQLTLEGQVISLQPGTFVVMPAHAPHAINAGEKLAFLLVLSEQS
jgi:quercetin dioxygenase-like cupin family protein